MTDASLGYLRSQYCMVLRRCAWLNALAFSAAAFLAGTTTAQPILPDGRTQTQLQQSGNVTDVHTATVRGQTGFNSFSRFNVNSGHVVNMHLPGSAANLLNVVRDEQTRVDGILNAYRNGQIGGNVFFLNPHGFVVGSQGVINVGSLTVATPTPAFLDQLIDPTGRIDDAATADVLAGRVPLTASGLITIEGRINARQSLHLAAGVIEVGAAGHVQAGPQAVASFGDVVNVEGLEQGVGVSTEGGVIRIVGLSDVRVAGRVAAEGANGVSGGDVEVRAERNIDVQETGVISAAGRGSDSDGGRVIVFAEDTATLAGGATVSAAAGESGDGGFVEFSARQTVHVQGNGLHAGATNGKGGAILIDPAEIIWTGAGQDVFSPGVSYTLQADDKIRLDDVMISTRQVGGAMTRAAHLNGSSTGNSGDITLEAPVIELVNGSALLAHATNGFTAGNILLDATEQQSTPVFTSFSNPDTSVLLDSATLRGGNVTVQAVADDTFEYTGNSAADVLLGFLDDLMVFADVTISTAKAKVEVGGNSTINASGDLAITSSAKADASMRVLSTAVGFGYGSAEADAQTIINAATVTAGGNADITSHSDSKISVTVSTTNTARTNPLAGGANKYIDIAAAVGVGEVISKANVNDGATLNVGGNLLLQATGDKSSSVSAKGGAYDDGTAGAAISVSLFTTDVQASLGGTVQDAGEVFINADLEALMNSTSAASNSGTGIVGAVGQVHPNVLLVDAMSRFVTKSSTASLDSRSGAGEKLGISASFAWVDHDNTVQSSVTATGKVLASDSTRVRAESRDVMQYKAGASVDVARMQGFLQSQNGKPGLAPNDPKKVALAAAVAVVDLDNSATAAIDGEVSSAGQVTVQARANVPIPGEVLWGDWSTMTDWTDYVQRVKNNLGSANFGTITGWTQSFAESEKLSVSGSFNKLAIDNQAHARIGSGAKVNSGATATAAQDVSVHADAHVGVVSLSGVFGYNPMGLFLGTQGSNAGFGGSYLQTDLTGGASAVLGPATVVADDLAVFAENDNNLITIGESGGKGGKISVNGVFTLVTSDTDTLAQIRPGAIVTADDVLVRASDDSDIINVAGGIAASNSVGIGVSVSINELERTTRALIANREFEPGAMSGGSVTSRGNLFIDAETTGLLGSFSLAAATPAPPGSSTGSSNDPKTTSQTAKGKGGVGFSGDVSINLIDDITEATAGNDVSITTKGSVQRSVGFDINGDGTADVTVDLPAGMKLEASNTTPIYAFAGAITIGTNQSVGIAGSFTRNLIEKVTEAQIDGATVTIEGGNLGIDAWNSGQLLAISAGGSGAQKVGVAGSISLNDIDNRAWADVLNDTVTLTTGSSSQQARDDSDIRAIAGAVTYGGKAGFGAAFSKNEIDNNTRAWLSNGTLSAPAGATLGAINDNLILSVSAAVGVSQTAGVAGSAAWNTIGNIADAAVTSATLNSSGGTALVKAEDKSEIQSYTGQVAVATSGSAFGATGAYNEITNQTLATATNATLDAQTVELRAKQEAEILAVAVGGAVSGGAAGISGSLVINTIDTTTKAYAIGGSQLLSDTWVIVEALDEADIDAITGAVGGASSGAVGASGSYNEISSIVEARIEGGKTDAAGSDVWVLATRDGRIFAEAVSGAASGSAGFAGSIAINTIGGSTTSKIAGGADVDAAANVRVETEVDQEIDAIAGGIAVAGDIGASGAIAVNYLSGDSNAEISGAGTDVKARALGGTIIVPNGRVDPTTGTVVTEDPVKDRQQTRDLRGVAVVASATNQINAASVNAAGGGYGGIAGSVNFSVIDGTTTAKIADGAKINNDLTGVNVQQEVFVSASHHARVVGGAGGLAIGGLGAGAAGSSESVVVGHQTRAEVSDSTIKARKAVVVDAFASNDLRSITAGAAGGVTGAFSGSINTIGITSDTRAILDGATIESQGTIDVLAGSHHILDLNAGNLAVGGAFGIGVSGGLVLVDDFTYAATLNSTTLNANGATTIAADSKKDLEAWAGTVSAAGGLSIAGTMVFNYIDGRTLASVGASTRINQDASFSGAEQDVIVRATDDIKVNDKLGSLAIDLGSTAVGATLDAVLVRNSVEAEVKGGAIITADRDITISAENKRDIDSLTIAGSGGLTTGISGAVSMINLGGQVSGDAQSESSGTVNDFLALMSGSLVGDQLDSDGGSSSLADDLDSRQGEFDLTSEYSAAPPSDRFTAKAHVGSGAQLTADRDLLVTAKNQNDIDAIAVGAAVSPGFALGGAVVLAAADDDSIASINGTLSAGRDLKVLASDIDLNKWSLQTYAGGGGAVGLGASVVIANQGGSAYAEQAGGSITSADLVEIKATLDQELDSDTLGGAVGILGVGVSYNDAEISGEASARALGNITADQLTVQAGTTTDTHAKAIAAAGGILSGAGADANATDRAKAVAELGSGTIRTLGGTTGVYATVNPYAFAEAIGVAIGYTASAGVSLADAVVDPTAIARTLDSANVNAGTLTIRGSITDRPGQSTGKAEATAASGAVFVGVGATEAETVITPEVRAYTGANGSFTVTGGVVTIEALSDVDGDTAATGVNFGLIAPGFNNSKTTINGVVTAALGDNANLSAATLKVNAQSEDDADAEVEAGAGGLGAVVAAKAETDTDSVTTASIGARTDTVRKIAADKVDVKASHTRTFSAEADSIKASVVGYSGARTVNNSDTTTTAQIGSGAKVETADFDLAASNTVTKPDVSGYNVTSGSGGVLDAAAAADTSHIRNTAVAQVGTNADIKSEKSGNPAGDLDIRAANTVNATGGTKLDSGGAIAIARAEAKVLADRNDARVVIGAGARLTSDGSIDLDAQSDGQVKAESTSKTYGAAGAAEGDSVARLWTANTIEVGANAFIESLEFVNLNAGTGNVIHADADTRLWNRTAIPVETKPDAHGEIKQNNAITVATGAQLRAVRDVNLKAGVGQHTTRGYGKGKDLYREVAAEIAGAFGIDAALDIDGGSTTDASLAGVRLDGEAVAGIRYKQYLTIDANGNVALDQGVPIQSDGVTFSRRNNVQLSLEIQQRIDELRAAEAAYRASGSTEDRAIADAFKAEADFLETRLAEANITVDFIDVHDITARTGDVNVTGNWLVGTGKLIAPGDAEIRVINNSTDFLSLANLTIPDEEGGRVTLNGVRVSSNSDIADRNPLLFAGGTASFASIVDRTSSPKPAILAQNTYDPDKPGNNPNLPAPQLFSIGDVSNLGGDVTYTSFGSVTVSGKVDADTINIRTAGDFIQNFVFGFRHTGGDPLVDGAIVGVQNGSEAPAWPFISDRVVASLKAGTYGSTIAGNSVFISAEKLNISGHIQSGLPIRLQTIESGKQGAINAFKQAYDNSGDPNKAANVNLRYLTLYDSNDPAWSGITARYDAENDRIEMGGVRVRGGHLELYGDIFSTGNGSLSVMDGFGRIEIDNKTNKAIQLARLDTGSGTAPDGGVEGMIRITDTSRSGAGGASYVTEVRRIGNQIRFIDNQTVDANGNPTNVFKTASGRKDVAYEPHANRDLNWVRGRKTTYVQTRIYTQKVLFDADWLFPDEDNPDSTQSSSQFFNRLQGDWLSVNTSSQSVNNDYIFDYSRSDSGYSYRPGSQTKSEKGVDHIYKEIRYERKYDRTVWETYHHAIAADKAVPIEFLGQDLGEVVISSDGSVLIGGPIRNLGGTTAISTDASVLGLPGGVVGGKAVTINATKGAIGAANALVGLDVGSSGLTAIGRDGVFVNETSGDLLVVDVRANAGNVHLGADGSIVLGPAGKTVVGQNITLASQSGGIGGSAASPLTIDTAASGKLTAAAADDIFIRETSGSLRIDQVASTGGDVVLSVPGDLLDANDFELADTQTQQELLQLYEDARLTGSFAEQSKADTLEAYAGRKETEYQAYWAARNVRQVTDNNGSTSWAADAYDPQYAFSLTAENAAALKQANGWSDADVTAYEQQQTAAYHEAHTAFGGLAYSPTFAYTLDASEENTLSEGYKWTLDELSNAIAAGVLRETSDTETIIEADNVFGREVTLSVTGNIGSTASPVIIARGATSLTDAQKIALASAERDDVTITDTEIRIGQVDDVDLTAELGLTATAGDKLYIGSEADLPLRSISGNTVRIKTGGGLLGADNGGVAHVTAQSLILEAAGGMIGDLADPLRVELPGASALVARADDSIYLREMTGDLTIGTIFSPRTVSLVAPGAVLDAGSDDTLDVRAESLIVSAGSIGGSTAGAALDVALDRTGSLAGTLTGSAYIASPDRFLRLGSVMAGGTIVVNSGDGIGIVGDLQSSAGVALTAAGELIMDAGTTINAAEQLALAAGGDIALARLLSASAADDSVSVHTTGGDIRTADPAQLNLEAPTGGAVLHASGSVGGDSAIRTRIRTLSATSTAAGSINISEADDLELTSLTTTDGYVTLSAGGDLTATAVNVADAGNDERHDAWLHAMGDLSLSDTLAADWAFYLTAGGSVTSGSNLVLDAPRAWLVASQGTLGAEAQPFVADIRGLLTAYGRQSVVLEQTGGALDGTLVVSSRGPVSVKAAGDLNLWQVSGTKLTFDAGGRSTIGTIGGNGPFILDHPHGQAGSANSALYTGFAAGSTFGQAITVANSQAWLPPQSVSLTATGPGATLILPRIEVTTDLDLKADNVIANVIHADPSQPLRLNIVGGQGGVANSITLSVKSDGQVTVEKIEATNAVINSTAPRLLVLNGFVGNSGVFASRDIRARIDTNDRRPHSGYDVRLFSFDGEFDLLLSGNTPMTRVFVIDFDPSLLINGQYHPDNSVRRLSENDLELLAEQLSDERAVVIVVKLLPAPPEVVDPASLVVMPDMAVGAGSTAEPTLTVGP